MNIFLRAINSSLIVDFFDVLIVAILMYVMIVLFKQTRSSLVLGGMGVLAALYAAAHLFRLDLTLFVLNIFFGMSLVILIIVFQEELRRFFAFLALLSTRRIRHERPLVPSSPLVEEITRAITNLAHRKIGALMVLPGNERIERYLEGGKTLDGVISEEIIESVFDPTSPGHDGAMIVQRGRIIRFGAHLPLSTNFREIGKRGTRHSAALGIAEHTDAFAIVVSEEQGTISVAVQGKLREVKNGEELKGRLNNFLKEKFPEESRGAFDHLIRKNSLEKILALAFTVVFKLLLNRP